jgi:hypothetical protein
MLEVERTKAAQTLIRRCGSSMTQKQTLAELFENFPKSECLANHAVHRTGARDARPGW